MLQRFRVRLAVWLCKGTPCLVARASDVMSMHGIALNLGRYVSTSGGLQDPKRIKAYRTVLSAATGLVMFTRNVIVGPFPKTLPPAREETTSNGSKEESKEQAA